MRGVDGFPIDRDEYATHLADRAVRLPIAERLPLLARGEAEAVAALLDEYAGIYLEEPIGLLARELAVRIYDRLEA